LNASIFKGFRLLRGGEVSTNGATQCLGKPLLDGRLHCACVGQQPTSKQPEADLDASGTGADMQTGKGEAGRVRGGGQWQCHGTREGFLQLNFI
jgi:hypothetical protein